MTHNERVFRRYTNMWQSRDNSNLGEIFADNIVYCESYGPEYHGLSQMRRWFADMDKRYRIIHWEIKRSFEKNGMLAVEWYLVVEHQDGRKAGYDGASIARFNAEGKIREMRDYRSEWQHTFPYGSEPQ